MKADYGSATARVAISRTDSGGRLARRDSVKAAASPLARSQPLRWDQQRRALLIAGRTIAFTPTEYRLCELFATGKPVTYAELAAGAYGCQLDRNVRVMLDKHIDRIRGKLHGSGLYIYCILGYGYMLLPEQEADAPSA